MPCFKKAAAPPKAITKIDVNPVIFGKKKLAQNPCLDYK
jgi:hypothetical protein